jgi:hypothetical protein
MIRRLLLLLFLAAIATFVARAIPDVARYLKMREM